jgi:hypothetical protein
MIGHWFVMTKHVTIPLAHLNQTLQVLGRLPMLQCDPFTNNPPALALNDSTRMQTLTLHSDVKNPLSSVIVSEFRGKQFSLLWRGSGDGFRVRDFHSCSDGHGNALAVILDTD